MTLNSKRCTCLSNRKQCIFICCIVHRLSRNWLMIIYWHCCLLWLVLIKIYSFFQSKKWRNLKVFLLFNNLVWIWEKYLCKTFRAVPKEIVGVSFVQRHFVDIKCLWWCTQLLSNHLCEKCKDLLIDGSASSPPPPKKGISLMKLICQFVPV